MAIHDPQRAVQSASQALALLDQRLPAQHPLRADASLTLCETLFEAGMLAQARSELARNQRDIEQALGSAHPRMLVLERLRGL